MREKRGKRVLSGILAIVLTVSGMGFPFPIPARASDVWPQKSTAPFYCLDGGKGWKKVDRYDIYQYDTLPSPLTVTQTKRLFWAYPDNWQALKDAAKKYDADLYAEIASTTSGPNTVKRVKDDAGTKFAWVADNPEIEARAIAVMEQASAEGQSGGKEAPEVIREATSEEKAVSFTVLPFSDGPGALDTEFQLGRDFIRDIASIEPQSVWDNGSTGGAAGWLDASQDKNIAKSAMGENLYEVTWGGDSIKIHNNGSAAANENAVGSTMTDEEKYNKTMVRYKITMRGNSGWYTEGSWNEDYLHEWMEFKACINAPEHQRLYRADIRIAPSDRVFYLVIDQGGSGDNDYPEYGIGTPEISFQVFRHEETFESNYNVRIRKYDDETGKPLKGSQFYLYEQFEDEGLLLDDQSGAGLAEENLSFVPWKGFQIFAEGTTNEAGEITHRDTRTYHYSKTYCDGHGVPQWAEVQGTSEKEEGEEDGAKEKGDGTEETKDRNRAAAQTWLQCLEECEKEAEESGTHFHWVAEEGALEEVLGVLEDGVVEKDKDRGDEDQAKERLGGLSAQNAFQMSGCQSDCEETYEKFIGLRFSYTWKEIQARNGYILHDLHPDDVPIEVIMTNSSEAGAQASRTGSFSKEISEQIWYAGNSGKSGNFKENPERLAVYGRLREGGLTAVEENLNHTERDPVPVYMANKYFLKMLRAGSEGIRTMAASGGNALDVRTAAASSGNTSDVRTAAASDGNALDVRTATASSGNALDVRTATAGNANGKKRSAHENKNGTDPEEEDDSYGDDSDWGAIDGDVDFQSCLDSASVDGIIHLKAGDPEKYSHCSGEEDCQDSWRVYDHRTEGRIHINKRDLDLYKRESENYSSYGDTEGDGTLEGAVYGLFAAENIIHPDSEPGNAGELKNTGIVYHQNDLVSMAVTDKNGNADFLAYTREPGVTYNYSTGQVEKRAGLAGSGPVNRYETNLAVNGNYWIGRPLILGKYYVKELTRSEGYELSINGISKEWTNNGTGFDTPPSISSACGTAVVSIPELSASMEGEDGSGTGYDQFNFSVVSSGTVNGEAGTDGYEIQLSGFPESTKFYRVDSGEEEVTGPHVTGTEETAVKDENGNPVWKRAESSRSNVKYQPEFGPDGTITGQTPVSRTERQILKAEQIPSAPVMHLRNLEIHTQEEIINRKISEYDLASETDEGYRFIKAVVEEILNRNGYDVPTTAEGTRSMKDAPVYSRGVRKGQPDLFAVTTKAGEPALKTVYGAAVSELAVPDSDQNTTIFDVIMSILSWYQEYPQWSFGGIDSVERSEEGYRITLYSGIASKAGRQFFTMKEDDGKRSVDKIYSMIENPVKLRWVCQEYTETGDYRYAVERQYYLGGSEAKRYYIDAALVPAVLVNSSGKLQEIHHTVMVYHDQGEEIIDYLSGDPANGYRIPLTKVTDKIEITTETELVDKDVPLHTVSYDRKTGIHKIHIEASGTDSFGAEFSDAEGTLKLNFMAVLPQGRTVLTEEDIASLGKGNVYEYTAGEEIGYAEYLMRFLGSSVSASAASVSNGQDSYIVLKSLVYRGQERVFEDGDTGKNPLQVLERPVKQKVRVVKEVLDGEAIGNFRFKIYLKSNLERLFCDENGEVFWVDKEGKPIEIQAYKDSFPELVQKIYTQTAKKRLLEPVQRQMGEGTENETGEVYNYEKFFDAVDTANTDRWHNPGKILNSSFKPFVNNRWTGVPNRVNTSEAAKENAKRSDAVRQFAVNWYLKEEAELLTRKIPENGEAEARDKEVSYPDEIYDRALYQAILKAEDYLKPFFLYDLDSVYEILWDSEASGGIDQDFSTLSAGQLEREKKLTKYAFGISKYLPYGDYVLVEQQPFKAEWLDFENKHYQIDTPKEISLPMVYEENSEGKNGLPEKNSSFYQYRKTDMPSELAKKYLLRFNEEWAENQTEGPERYVIHAHNHDGDFELYPYGLDKDRTAGHYEPYGNPAVAAYYHYSGVSEDALAEMPALGMAAAMKGVRTAYDGKYAAMLVPWTLAEPEGENDSGQRSGYANVSFLNRLYQVKLRIEKLDAETGEPILNDDAVFGLYKAERNEAPDGDGEVKRYERDTVIAGSREFLEAMGAKYIAPFARAWGILTPAGKACYGTIPKGTPICREEDCVMFSDGKGVQTGVFSGLSTVYDSEHGKILQTTGYFETPEPLKAGVYVLAELKVPDGYTRSNPISVEIYSDSITYALPDGEKISSAVVYPYQAKGDGERQEDLSDAARIYVNNTATSLEVSKVKTLDSYRGMKVSGRVEGSISALRAEYGLENLELAYNSQGVYQGFGWKKGTLEYLESRKNAGERMELVYENGVFQGYGYVTRTLETADDETRYIPGAKLALYEAIEVQLTKDSEDASFEGVKIVRDRNGNVTDIYVEEGYAGERTEFIRKEEKENQGSDGAADGIWTAERVKRKDTQVLFYDLGGLQVIYEDPDGVRYGYDRHGKKQRITFDTDSIYALRGGRPVFEISGGDLSQLVYDRSKKAFTAMSEESKIYHLNAELCRDAQADGYTGLAYIEKAVDGSYKKDEHHVYVWPVTVVKGTNGTVLSREKILTGRPGEVNAGEENAYLTGTWNEEKQEFQKKMAPVYDEFGMVRFYQKSGERYKKGRPVYDRDGDYVYYQYDDLLRNYNRAAYMLKDYEALYHIGNPESGTGEIPLERRSGEALWIPNVWISGKGALQDGVLAPGTNGQPETLRRVIPGTYIMEELSVPDGYSRALPVAVRVYETEDMQRVSMIDEKIKIEIAKIDGTEEYRIPVADSERGAEPEWGVEGNNSYTGKLIPGAVLALFKAKRVYCSDYETFPKGYYLVKAEDTPAAWEIYDSDNHVPVLVTAKWITDEKTKYFEGIPAGDYILEELETPAGYIPNSMEIEVKSIPDLQSFLLKDDHTKMEIFKYEKGPGNKRIPLEWPLEAEFSLYPALLDTNGDVQKDGETCLYQEDSAVDVWKTSDLSEYVPDMVREYEKLFEEYEDQFSEFTWNVSRGGKQEERRAVLVDNNGSGNRERVTQLWRMEDGSLVRIGISRDGKSQISDSAGRPAPAYEYQFHYRSGGFLGAPDLVSYDTRSGIHRIDKLPVGKYVLVETKAPDGYQKAEPMIVTVESTADIQRYGVENQRKPGMEIPKGIVRLVKRDSEEKDKKLSGAWFEVRNIQTGESCFIVTDEDGKAESQKLPIGRINAEGVMERYTYEVRETWPPEHYCISPTVWTFQFEELKGSGAGISVYEIQAENKQTEILLSKSDFHTGHFVSGAKLSIYQMKLIDGEYQPEGEAVESWISRPGAHRIKGKLSAGRTYLLVEEEPPKGYAAAKPMRFTVSTDGRKITGITDDLNRVQIEYEDQKNQIKAISVTGRMAFHMQYSLLRKGGEILHWLGTGKERRIFAEEGEMLTLSEQLIFSDGSSVPIRRETFRVHMNGETEYPISERLPVAVECSFKDQNGNLISCWRPEWDSLTCRIENCRDADGSLLLKPGNRYIFEESVLFEEGIRVVTGKTELVVNEEGGVAQADLKNRETEVHISKRDMTTGEELPGAKLTLKDENGTVMEQWISEEAPHIIKGKLTAGSRYTLYEELAPDGYEEAEEISFTVSADGAINRAVMEDRKRPEKPDEPDKPEKPDEPDEPDKPDEPEKPDEPKKPDEPEKPDEPKEPYEPEKPDKNTPPQKTKRPKPVEAEWPKIRKTTGIITAKYERTLSGEGAIHLKRPGKLQIHVPKTGDERKLELYIWGILLSAAGIAWVWRKRGKGSD